MLIFYDGEIVFLILFVNYIDVEFVILEWLDVVCICYIIWLNVINGDVMMGWKNLFGFGD